MMLYLLPFPSCSPQTLLLPRSYRLVAQGPQHHQARLELLRTLLHGYNCFLVPVFETQGTAIRPQGI